MGVEVHGRLLPRYPSHGDMASSLLGARFLGELGLRGRDHSGLSGHSFSSSNPGCQADPTKALNAATRPSHADLHTLGDTTGGITTTGRGSRSPQRRDQQREHLELCLGPKRVHLQTGAEDIAPGLLQLAPLDRGLFSSAWAHADWMHAEIMSSLEAIDAWPPRHRGPQAWWLRRKFIGRNRALQRSELLLPPPSGDAHVSMFSCFLDALQQHISHGCSDRVFPLELLWGIHQVRAGLGSAWDLLLLHGALSRLVERHAGRVLPMERIEHVEMEDNRVVSLRLLRGASSVRCGHLLWNRPVASLFALLQPESQMSWLAPSMTPLPAATRYSMHVLVRPEGIPEGLPRHTWLLDKLEDGPVAEFSASHAQVAQRGASSIPVHVERLGAFSDSAMPQGGLWGAPAHPAAMPNERDLQDRNGRGAVANALLDTEVLVASVVVPLNEAGQPLLPVSALREELRARLERAFPFFGAHVQCIDSPHDGLDPYHPPDQSWMPASHVWQRGTHSMDLLWRFPHHDQLEAGLELWRSLPTQTPYENLGLMGQQVMPGFGLEGTLFSVRAAFAAVRARDPRGTAARRGNWMRLR